MNAQDRTAEILQRIADAAVQCGRSPDAVAVMAVTKTRTPEAIREVTDAGIRLIGENRVQELAAKAPDIDSGVTVHMIGPLQSNKVKTAVNHCSCIQSVDREKILQAIDRWAGAAGKVMEVMIEVNTSGESAKHGVQTSDALYRLTDLACELPQVELTGLMTIGPLTEDEQAVRRAFARLYELRVELSRRYPDLPMLLSMGMSQDFELAVREGSDMLRIGGAFFS